MGKHVLKTLGTSVIYSPMSPTLLLTRNLIHKRFYIIFQCQTDKLKSSSNIFKEKENQVAKRLKVSALYISYMIDVSKDKNRNKKISNLNKNQCKIKGNYIGFVPDTIRAFQKCGMNFYNEAILLNAVASASMRANGNMKSQKLVKIHQNILIFKKS